MIVALARALTRLIALVVLVALALAGLAAAVFCIEGADGTLSLPSLASDLHLADLRDSVGSFLGSLEGHGPVAVVAALSGAGAVLLGAVMLIGALMPGRERLVTLSDGDDGVIAARRRALGQAVTALAEQPRVVLGARARVRPSRRDAGGRLRVRADRDPETADREAVDAVAAALQPLTGALSLHPRVRTRARRRRVGRAP